VALLRDLSSDLRGTPPATFVALGQLTERLDHVRVAARADFATRFAAYDTDDTQQVFAKMLQGLRS